MSKKDKKKSKYNISSIALATTILNFLVALIDLIARLKD